MSSMAPTPEGSGLLLLWLFGYGLNTRLSHGFRVILERLSEIEAHVEKPPTLD